LFIPARIPSAANMLRHQSYGPYAKGQWAGVDQSMWSDKGWVKGKGPALWGKGGFAPSNYSVFPSADQDWGRAVWGCHEGETDVTGAGEWSGSEGHSDIGNKQCGVTKGWCKGWGKSKQPVLWGKGSFAPRCWSVFPSADQGWEGKLEAARASGKSREGTGKGQPRNGKKRCRPDTEQDLETDANPDDEEWSVYSLLGGPSQYAITVASRAQLVNMILDDKITIGTLSTWQGVTFDAFFWLYGGFDSAEINIKALCRNSVTPKNIVSELKKTHDEFHRLPDAPTEALATVLSRCPKQEDILRMALCAGFPPQVKPPQGGRTYQTSSYSKGDKGRSGYGSRYVSDEHITSTGNKRVLQAAPLDVELELVRLHKHRRLAKALTALAMDEFEAAKQSEHGKTHEVDQHVSRASR
jgi:hypothetical protein